MKTVVIYLGQDRVYKDLPMTELNYIKDFRARMVKRGPNYVVLDRTALRLSPKTKSGKDVSPMSGTERTERGASPPEIRWRKAA